MEPNLHRQMWEDTLFREGIERRMREQLLRRVVEERCVPVALPTAAYRYFTDPAWGLAPFDMRRRPVLPELVELGAPWEFIEVELSVPVRRVGSLEQSNSQATQRQRGEPSVGAQP
ncbi:hypothetical protein [Nonomuraea sp. JJY05]|uniref:hypothetical protein n=1 Tax=Nonomuraea sp. JJY05 TaxID=3350255 RepID=UPI00373F91E2